MLGAVAHIGITVRDMEGALRFYRDLLGLKMLGDITMREMKRMRSRGKRESSFGPCTYAARKI